MINVEHLTYEYPGKLALDDISFHIRKEAITAVVGPNGAGKTTLLKSLSALTRPFAGRIFINNINILEEPRECHKIIGFLPDFFGLYDSLTVDQALKYFALAQNVEKTKTSRRINEVCEKLNLKEKRYEKIGTLSRGMRQRVGIAQAMIHDPDVLILDEPASGLDPEARYSLSCLFLELNRQGKTLVVSSHILAELDQYATDMLILRHGKLIENNILLNRAKEKKKILIRVSDNTDYATEIIKNAENAEYIKSEKDEITVHFAGDDASQCNLLKLLIDSGISVKEFYVKKQGIQEQYLETEVLHKNE